MASTAPSHVCPKVGAVLFIFLLPLWPQGASGLKVSLMLSPYRLPMPLATHKECTSIDIRNDCVKLELLNNCTVITGYVMITLMGSHKQCNYTNYRYPMLREITDFIVFTEVRGLISLKAMFPNLIVIRGRRLFLNYALGVTNMPDLQLLEFPSLVAIQQGHVYIGTSPKLCQIERINWDRLTLSTGENHIVMDQKNCKQRPDCKGCPSTYCWSNFVCQRFENDNVIEFDGTLQHCHAQCLGGCYNNSAAGCVVCRGLSDNNVCVESCPADKYVMEQYQRCYTRDQCIARPNRYTFGFTCVLFCPSGFKANEERDCIRCEPDEPCISVCSPEHPTEAITIYNLADAAELSGCQILNSSLVITIRNQVHEQQLAKSLSTIREIRGHVKVYRSSQLTSLQFLKNLQKIHGDPLENRHYALVLYDNKQLRELWTPDAKLEFVNGGMYMHRNNRLCNHHMLEFQTRVTHDKALDSLQTSDQEVLCGPSKLQLDVRVRSQRRVQLSWSKSQTSAEVEVIYRSMAEGQLYSENSELEAPVCTRINWQRRLLFPDELQTNGTHYSYQLQDLQPSTRYACLVRTFGGDFQREARSDLIYMHTPDDIPQPPRLLLGKKTEHTLTLQLLSVGNGSTDYYELSVYELRDDVAYIDERDYCKQPSVLWQEMDGSQWKEPVLEYDDCCARQAELVDDRRFIEEMRRQYRCSLDAPANCLLEQQTTQQPPMMQQHLGGNTTLYTLRDLQRYQLYSLQLRACNALGCSTHTTLNARTNYSLSADLLPDLNACRVPGTEEYIVRFVEPAQPNGVIVSYVIHFRANVSNTLVLSSHVSCVTRRAHAEADFVHVAQLNVSYNECAVRVYSLAGDVLTPYINITWCDEQQRTTPKSSIIITTERPLGNETQPTEDTSFEQSHVRGISIFLFCFLFGCSVSAVWIVYKRRCWRKLPGLRHYVPVREQWLREQSEDREILVDGFETVRFQNNISSSNDAEVS